MNKLIILIVIIIVGTLAAIVISNQTDTKPATQTISFSPTTAPTQSSQQPSQTEISPIPTTEFVNASNATIQTEKGSIEIILYKEDAPKTVTNFSTLAKTGYFNNLTFHRVEPGFVIQGGDPNGNGTGGTSIYGGKFEDELNPDSPSYKEGYKEGIVAMANSGPNTNGSQFFIMLADNETLPKNYTIFGKVTSGMDVVKQIAKGDKIIGITVE